MTYTLQNLLVDVYRRLGELVTYPATGGTTTTIVDTKLTDRQHMGVAQGLRDKTFADGAAFIIYDAGGENAAPEGEMQRISSFNESNGTITVDTAFTTAPAALDVYGFTPNKHPLYAVIQAANIMLGNLGDIILTDTTTLDTAANQTEYTCSAAWQRGGPVRVDIQTNTADADDNRWKEYRDWQFIPATAGADGLIVFRTQPPSVRDIRVWYKTKHPYVTAYNDVIHESITPDLAVVGTIVAVFERDFTQGKGSSEMLNYWRQEYEMAKQKFPIRKHRRKGGLTIAGDTSGYSRYTDDATRVRL